MTEKNIQLLNFSIPMGDIGAQGIYNTAEPLLYVEFQDSNVNGNLAISSSLIFQNENIYIVEDDLILI